MVNKIKNPLGEYIKKKRGDMSLRDFAKQCDNISHTRIDSIERGYNTATGKPVKPTIETFIKLSKGTGASVAYLASLASGEELSPVPEENRYIPIIGSVRCGPNGLAYQYLDGCVYIDNSFYGDIVAFRCKGDSMKDLGIYDGDIAIVRLQEEVENGELAVVTINGDEGALKRIRLFDGGIILESANQAYAPRVFTGEQLNLIHIVGKVLEIRKRF